MIRKLPNKILFIKYAGHLFSFHMKMNKLIFFNIYEFLQNYLTILMFSFLNFFEGSVTYCRIIRTVLEINVKSCFEKVSEIHDFWSN